MDLVVDSQITIIDHSQDYTPMHYTTPPALELIPTARNPKHVSKSGKEEKEHT